MPHGKAKSKGQERREKGLKSQASTVTKGRRSAEKQRARAIEAVAAGGPATGVCHVQKKNTSVCKKAWNLNYFIKFMILTVLMELLL